MEKKESLIKTSFRGVYLLLLIRRYFILWVRKSSVLLRKWSVNRVYSRSYGKWGFIWTKGTYSNREKNDRKRELIRLCINYSVQTSYQDMFSYTQTIVISRCLETRDICTVSFTYFT